MMYVLELPCGYIENIYPDSLTWTPYIESALRFENKLDAEKYADKINADVVKLDLRYYKFL